MTPGAWNSRSIAFLAMSAVPVPEYDDPGPVGPRRPGPDPKTTTVTSLTPRPPHRRWAAQTEGSLDMQQTKLLTVIAAIVLATALAPAADVYWNGLDRSGGTGDGDVDVAANWDVGSYGSGTHAVPTTGDMAYFELNSNDADLFVGAAATMDPSGLNYAGGGLSVDPVPRQEPDADRRA